MEVRKIEIDGVKYNTYRIEYKGLLFEVGDYHLSMVIDMALEKGIYDTKKVIEDSQIKTLQQIDEDIYCFLSRTIQYPTEQEIIEEVKVILDEYFD